MCAQLNLYKPSEAKLTNFIIFENVRFSQFMMHYHSHALKFQNFNPENVEHSTNCFKYFNVAKNFCLLHFWDLR